MKELQFSIIEPSKKERRDVNKLKRVNVIRQILIISLPLITCYFIPLFAMIYFDLSEGKLQKEIYFDLTVSIKHAVFDSLPCIIVSIYSYYLIKKGRGTKEIAIKMACMLLPIMVFGFYWELKYILSPLALGFLPFINMIILIPAWLVGVAVSAALKDARNQ